MDYGSIKTWTIRGLIGFVLAAIVAFVFPPIQPLIRIEGGITIFGNRVQGSSESKTYLRVENPLKVNYSTSIADAIKKGSFWLFPPTTLDELQRMESTEFGEKTIDIKLFNFGWKIIEIEGANKGNILQYEAQVLLYTANELDKVGYRPASLSELLAFGAAYPSKVAEFKVFALGSRSTRVQDGVHRFFFPSMSGKNSVSLDAYIGNPGYYFLAVKK